MNFSRLKLAQPSPPLPAWTSMMDSSTNFMVVKIKRPCRSGRAFVLNSLASGGNDAHRLAAVRALLGELDAPRDPCEQCVVTADADVLTCMNTGSALADDDAARVDKLATEAFHAEALRL
jgi:hypothetical protein